MMTQQEITDEYVEGFFHFLQWADLFLLSAVILVIADLFFGIKAAKKRGEIIRRSRALARSIDKICSYSLWLLVAYTFGMAFDQEWLPTLMIVLIYVREVESLYKNYFEWKGFKIKIDLMKLFSKKVNFMEIMEEDNKEEQNEKDK